MILLVAFFVFSLFVRPVFAQEKPDDNNVQPNLRYNWKIDLAVTSIAASGWIITESARNQLAPKECRWCQVNSFDNWGRDNLRFSDTGPANIAVNITAYGLAPMAALGLDAIAANYDKQISNFWIDALMISESAALASFTSNIVKLSVGRQRPHAHFGDGSNSGNDNMSFYSGHTTLAFSLAVSSGTVATLRGYELAPWIWGSGLAIAATTGYLSIAADRHYLTDVIAGAVFGSAFGFGIPYLFHRPRKEGVSHAVLSASPVEGGGLLNLSGRW